MERKKNYKKGYAGAILMDLSEVFNTINHYLLIEKLNDEGFSKGTHLIILDYLSSRKEGMKIHNSFSSWT